MNIQTILMAAILAVNFLTYLFTSLGTRISPTTSQLLILLSAASTAIIIFYLINCAQNAVGALLLRIAGAFGVLLNRALYAIVRFLDIPNMQREKMEKQITYIAMGFVELVGVVLDTILDAIEGFAENLNEQVEKMMRK